MYEEGAGVENNRKQEHNLAINNSARLEPVMCLLVHLF